jgi:Ras-related protein Rab-7A
MIKSKNNKLSKTIVILGDKETGKTCLFKKFTKKKFDDKYKETIGVDFFMKETHYNETEVVYNLWDTASNESEIKILPSQIYKATSCFFICCSYDNISTLESLKTWIDHVLKYNTPQNGLVTLKTPVVILFNKFDLPNKAFKPRDIRQKITKLMEDYEDDNIFVIEKVSAKDDLNLKNLFKFIIEYAINDGCIKSNDYIYNVSEMINEKLERRSFRLDTTVSIKTKKKSCC